MKKYLSVLLAIVLLLAALPLGVTAAKPALNLMQDGDFEEHYDCRIWTVYQNTHMSYDAALHGINGAYLQGNGGWGSMLEQTAPVALGKAYHLEFWYKVIHNGFNWRLEQSGDNGLYETRWETAGEWTRVTYDFVAVSHAVTLNFCGSGNGIREAAYIDDVVLTPLAAHDFDGYIYNGDFERGDLSNWEPFQNTTLAETSEDDYGYYCAHLQGNGGWGALLEQTFATKAGVQYTVGFRYKVNQNGFNLQIKDEYGVALAGTWCTDSEWTDGELTFVANGDTAVLNLCGGGNGIPEDAYVDDLWVYVSGEGDPDDLVDDGPDAWMTYQGTYWTEEASYLGGNGIHLLGDGGWGALAERTLPTVAGETYYLSFWYQANQTGFNLNIRNTADGSSIQTGWYDAAEWTYIEMEFVAPSNAVTLNVCGGGNGIPEDAYLDEVVLWSDLWEEIPDAAIRNGDFETGSPLGWGLYQSTKVVADAAYSGEYGAMLVGNGGWGSLLEQGCFTPGFTYAVTFRYKVLSEGFNLNIVDGETDEILSAGWYTSTEWEEVTLEFTTLSSTLWLNFCGGGTGIPEEAYIDDVTITCLDEDWEIPMPTMRDVALLQRYLNGWDVEMPLYADNNGDGEIDNKDLVLLVRFLNGWFWSDILPE